MTKKEAIKELEAIDEQDLWIMMDGRYIPQFMQALKMAIEALKAEPKTGKWIKTVNGNGWNEWYVLKCPFCGATIEDKQYRSWKYNCCPNCRAKMEGE